jgi:DNA gyrase subunit A
LIKAFIDHRIEVLTNKYNAELADANERIEILSGLINVTQKIDEAIKIIRNCDNPEAAMSLLIEKKIVFTERQAKAVLAITLAKLTKLEQNALLDEKNKKEERVKYLTKILADAQEILSIIIQEQKELAEKFGNDRRTVISGQMQLINEADLIAREDVVVCITTDDCIKRVALKEYRKQNRGGMGVISGNTSNDLAMQYMFTASTHDDLLCFTDTGRAFSIKVYELPEATRSARGRPIINFINLREDEKVRAYLPVKSLSKQQLFVNFISKNGYVKRSAIRHYIKIDKSGVIATKIKEDDKIVNVFTSTGIDDILLVTHQGMAIRFNEADLNIMGRNAQGVCAMKVSDDDYVVNGISIPMIHDKDGEIVTLDGNMSMLTYTERGFGKRTYVDQYLVEPTDGGKLRPQSKGGKGRIDIRHDKKTGKSVGAMIVNDSQDLVIITKQGQMVRIPAESIKVIGRGTTGVKLVKLAENDEIVAASAVYARNSRSCRENFSHVRQKVPFLSPTMYGYVVLLTSLSHRGVVTMGTPGNATPLLRH